MKTSESKTTTDANQIRTDSSPFFSKSAELNDHRSSSSAPFFSPAGIQAKLTVGQPGDKYEQEADATADQVVQKLASGEGIQRKCAACEQEDQGGIAPKLQRKAIFESNEEVPGSRVQRSCGCAACQAGEGGSLIQRMEGEEEEALATKLQRMEEEDETMQGKSAGPEGMQMQGMEEEEMMQGKSAGPEGLQMQGMEEEEMMQGKSAGPEGLQLQGMEEEELMQGKARGPEGLQLQGMEEEELMQGKAQGPEGLQLQEMEEEETMQAKSNGPDLQASSDLEKRLNATKGGGSPLPEQTRGSMESAFGTDFSGVRVHSDNTSVQMNQELGAQAFTHGSDVYFNSGKYDTQSSGGQHLLAHELTHVVQQGGSGPKKEE